MIKLFYDRTELLSSFDPTSWQAIVFKEFATTLTSKAKPFPCVFGASGFAKNQLRFGFSEDMNPNEIAPILKHFVMNCRGYGENTSLVMFSKPDDVETVSDYYLKFWHFLKSLAALDDQEWPSDVPEKLNTPLWEFCFSGQSIFVVCNTPAHSRRRSRYSPSMTITFQPRWVFDDLLGTEESANKAFSAVRERLQIYDISPISPHLGKYGEEHVREFKQYFLLDDEEEFPCPFTTLKEQE